MKADEEATVFILIVIMMMYHETEAKRKQQKECGLIASSKSCVNYFWEAESSGNKKAVQQDMWYLQMSVFQRQGSLERQPLCKTRLTRPSRMQEHEVFAGYALYRSSLWILFDTFDIIYVSLFA